MHSSEKKLKFQTGLGPYSAFKTLLRMFNMNSAKIVLVLHIKLVVLGQTPWSLFKSNSVGSDF